MPKVVRERLVVDGDAAEVMERVHQGLHHQWLAGVEQAWVVSRSDLDGFEVAVGARSAMDWGRTVLTGRFVPAGEGRTEVALEVRMSQMGVWFSRLWGLVAFCAFVCSALNGSGLISAYMLLMLGFIYVPSALAAAARPTRPRSVRGRLGGLAAVAGQGPGGTCRRKDSGNSPYAGGTRARDSPFGGPARRGASLTVAGERRQTLL